MKNTRIFSATVLFVLPALINSCTIAGVDQPRPSVFIPPTPPIPGKTPDLSLETERRVATEIAPTTTGTSRPTPTPVIPPVAGQIFSITDGYQDKISYYPGEKAEVFLNTSEIGTGTVILYSATGEVAATVKADMGPQQIPPGTPKPWESGFNYQPSFTFTVPELKSGIYLWDRKVPMIVKEPEKKADIVIVYPSHTTNAYADTGRKSIYDYNSPEGRSFIVSFKRPILPDYFAEGFMRWINTYSDYTIRVISDTDMENYEELAGAKIIAPVGHSEYWTRKARENFDRFVDSGGHAVVLSGNTMYWQARLSPDNSQLICYKDWELDPETDFKFKTVNWLEPPLEYHPYTSIGVNWTGYGKLPDPNTGIEMDIGWNGYKIVTAESPLLENTGLKKGDIFSLPTHETDGTMLKGMDAQGYPVIDLDGLGFHKGEIIGFDWSYNEVSLQQEVATFAVFQKSPSSGIVINAGSTNWGCENGIEGEDGEIIRTITRNMFGKLMKNEPVFSR